jgi:DNA-directed RNA polymerase subunit N (RpoN/RPB10)
MSEKRRCFECGKILPDSWPQNICEECLNFESAVIASDDIWPSEDDFL